MIFKNNNYNFLLLILLFLILILTIIISIGNYEKLDKEKRKEKGKYMSYILGFLGLIGVMFLIISNMNKGVFTVFGMDMERGLVIYMFVCFLLAFAF